MISEAIAQGLTLIEPGVNWGTVILCFAVVVALLLLAWHKMNPSQIDEIIAKVRALFSRKK